MESNNGEYIIVDFTVEELALISERANHLSMIPEREEGSTNKILEDCE